MHPVQFTSVGAVSPVSDRPLDRTTDNPPPARSFTADPQRIDAELLGAWRRLYPWDHWESGAVPVGMATVLLRRSLEAGCQSSSSAAAALMAATAAVQRIPTAPYGRSLGVQRYAADVAVLLLLPYTLLLLPASSPYSSSPSSPSSAPPPYPP